jgi:hypothetical protein
VDPNAFKLWDSAELYKAIDVLVLAKARSESLEIPKVRYNDMVKTFGFRPSSNGLLADVSLRTTVPVVQALTYDWVHTFLADGLVTGAAWGLIKKACVLELATQNDVHVFLRMPWTFAKRRSHYGRNLARVFDQYGAQANATSSTIKASASEMLSLYGLLRHWAATSLPTGDARLAEEVAIFGLAADCLDTVLNVKRGLVATRAGGAELQRKLVQHGERHMRHHGSKHWKPKNHLGL